MRDFPFEHPTHAGKRASMPLAMFPLGRRGEDAVHAAAIDRADMGTLLWKDR